MLIDGKAIATQIEDEIKRTISSMEGRPPGLCVVLVGDDPASHVYVGSKQKACGRVGIYTERIDLPSSTSEETLLQIVAGLNDREDVDGILVQLPLPRAIDAAKVCHAISPDKDVDGFHPTNVGKLLMGDTDGFVPCTAAGIQKMLSYSGISTEGRHVVIVGRSNIVGKPLAALLVQKAPDANATVTIAHGATRNLKDICLSADILVAAAGRPGLITADMVAPHAAVIDVGTNRVEDSSKKSGYRLVGDVDFDNVKNACSAISPVPGGVGPMTIAMLLHNTMTSRLRRVLV